MKINIDNPIFETLGYIGDFVILNILWVICCIPIFTIGAAQTAMYQVMMRRVRKESQYAAMEFFQAFRREFKKSTVLWLGFLITGLILVFDVIYIGQAWSLIGIGIGCLLFLWIILYSYVFPLQARFDNTYKNLIKNAAYMSVKHFPFTLIIVTLNMLPIIFFLLGSTSVIITAPIFFTIGFSLIARVNAALCERIFVRYIK